MVIVGTGPAGGSAAVRSASAGLKTLVLDRKAEVGIPVRCGEAVAEDVVKEEGIRVKEDFIRNRVNAGEFISSAGRHLKIRTKNTGLILNRTNFEQYLIDTAVSSGAVLAMKTNVTGLSKSGIKIGDTKVKSKVIIAADGVDSTIGSWAGLDTTLSMADIGICGTYVVSNFEMDSKKVEMWWGAKFVSGCGYAWVFPRGDGSANIGLGVAGVHVPKSGVRPLLDKFVDMRCGKNCSTDNFQVGSIPQSGPMDKTVSNNVILVGDAARFTIPLTGSGIGHALYSGRLAVNTYIEMQESGAGLDYLQNYDAAWRKKLTKKLRRAYKIKERFRRKPESIETMFKVLKPLEVLHRVFPNFIERVALRDFRY